VGFQRNGLRMNLSLVSKIGLGMNFTFTSSHFLSMRSLLVLAVAKTWIWTLPSSGNAFYRLTMKRPSMSVGSSKSTKINL
jgi:hypothetical protein